MSVNSQGLQEPHIHLLRIASTRLTDRFSLSHTTKCNCGNGVLPGIRSGPRSGRRQAAPPPLCRAGPPAVQPETKHPPRSAKGRECVQYEEHALLPPVAKLLNHKIRRVKQSPSKWVGAGVGLLSPFQPCYQHYHVFSCGPTRGTTRSLCCWNTIFGSEKEMSIDVAGTVVNNDSVKNKCVIHEDSIINQHTCALSKNSCSSELYMLSRSARCCSRSSRSSALRAAAWSSKPAAIRWVLPLSASSMAAIFRSISTCEHDWRKCHSVQCLCVVVQRKTLRLPPVLAGSTGPCRSLYSCYPRMQAHRA